MVRWMIGNALAAALDAAVGMFLVALFGALTETPVALPHLALGALLALLPDADLLPGVLLKDVQGNHRTTYFHKPVLLVPLAAGIAYGAGGGYWALVAGACVLWHYLHDTIEGITWLWPLSPKFYSFKGPKDDLLVVDHGQWLERTWLNPNERSQTELLLAALLALAALALSFA